MLEFGLQLFDTLKGVLQNELQYALKLFIVYILRILSDIFRILQHALAISMGFDVHKVADRDPCFNRMLWKSTICSKKHKNLAIIHFNPTFWALLGMRWADNRGLMRCESIKSKSYYIIGM